MGPNSLPCLLEKTFPPAAGFVLRQHHLLAIMGMTPILFQGTLESQNSAVMETVVVKMYLLTLTLHLDHLIKI